MKQVNVRIDEELIKKVKRICLEKNISFQKAVELALLQWLEKENLRYK